MINKVTLIGNVGQDPDIRTLENGTQVGRFSLATNESFKDKNGEWQTQTEWHNVVVWRELAERAAQNIKKGLSVYVEGKIQSRKYTDKEGVERVGVDIVASTFRSLEKKEKTGNDFVPTSEPSAPAKQAAQTPPTNGDDLPF
jgi:single-strand DNA-binding protein